MKLRTAGQIVAVGDLVWDVLTKPDRMLLPGGDTTGRIQLAPGGSAANVAVWIARSGGHAGFIGSVGQDTLGDLLVADMEKEQVDTDVHRLPDCDTGVIMVLIDRSGQRGMVTNQGADFHLLPEHLPVATLEQAAHVHLTAWSLFTDPPRTAAIRAAQIAKAAGASVSLDPASYQMIRDMGSDRFVRLTEGMDIDILFPNRDEGEALTGERQPERIAEVLRHRYNGAIIALKLDDDGCYVLSDSGGAFYPTEPVKVIDTTGAGDSFDAAFLTAYQQTGNLEKAALFANGVGRWVVARFGARPDADDAFAQLRATIA